MPANILTQSFYLVHSRVGNPFNNVVTAPFTNFDLPIIAFGDVFKLIIYWFNCDWLFSTIIVIECNHMPQYRESREYILSV